jgi:hypothetical protein
MSSSVKRKSMRRIADNLPSYIESSEEENGYDSDRDFLGDLEEVELNPDSELSEDNDEDAQESSQTTR